MCDFGEGEGGKREREGGREGGRGREREREEGGRERGGRGGRKFNFTRGQYC